MPKRRKRPKKYNPQIPEAPKTPDVDPNGGAYLNYRASLPGWPGYRTRPGRSGYDYLDNRFEWAHVQGILLRKLFTGKFRTRNPFYLIMMGFCGLVYCTPLLLGLGEFFALLGFAGPITSSDFFGLLFLLLVLSIISVPGVALIVNLFLNLFS